MSKLTTPTRIALLIAVLALLLYPVGMLPPATQAQERDLPGRPAGPETGVDLDLLRRLEEVALRVRGLPPARDIPVRVLSRDELRAYVDERVDAQLTEEEEDRSSAAWKLLVILGMIEPGWGEQSPIDQTLEIAGLYSSERKVMLIITARASEFDIEDQLTFLHEYVHALQDQRFDLTAFLEDVRLDGDATQSRRALVEGDATLAGMIGAAHVFAEQSGRTLTEEELALFLGFFTQVLEGQLDSDSGDEDDEDNPLPYFVERQYIFSYIDGMRFVFEAYRRTRDFTVVDQMYANPPRSSEHVLHPEKYWAGEMPVPVTLPDVAAALGDGWRESGRDTLGELDLQQLLGTHCDRDAARTAAAGWGGGRWMVMERGPQAAAVLRLVWDTELDAREFYDVYAHCLHVRLPEASIAEASVSRHALDAPALATELRIDGAEVNVVLAADRTAVDAISRAVGTSRG